MRKIKDYAGWGERIRASRRRGGLTQGDLARAIGVALPTVVRWEHGDAVCKVPEVREKLAVVLGVELKWLETGEAGVDDMLIVAARRVPPGLRRAALAMLRGLIDMGEQVAGPAGVQANAVVVSTPSAVLVGETNPPSSETKAPSGETVSPAPAVPPGYVPPRAPGV